MKADRKKRTWVYVIALLAFIGFFCVSSYMVFSQLWVDYRQNQAFGSLIEQVNQARNNPDMLAQHSMEGARLNVAQDESIVTPEPVSMDGAEKGAAVIPEQAAAEATAEAPAAVIPEAPAEAPTATVMATATPVPPMLSAYAPLYQKNSDFFGWIEIEGTIVNYPVMYTPSRPEYYLHRAFDRSEAYSGVPFLSADCFVGCGNYLIYGHHIKNGTQFAAITEYSSEDFWKEHPTVRFDTLYEVGVYDVVAAFYSEVYPNDMTDVFRYYQYTDLREEKAFMEYVRQVKEAALYETGLELQFGDQLLTLSTCEYHQTNGRFVVVARKR